MGRHADRRPARTRQRGRDRARDLPRVHDAIAYVSVREFAKGGLEPDRGVLAIVSSIALLAWCLMISQAIESVTRAF